MKDSQQSHKEVNPIIKVQPIVKPKSMGINTNNGGAPIITTTIGDINTNNGGAPIRTATSN